MYLIKMMFSNIGLLTEKKTVSRGALQIKILMTFIT